MNMPINAISRSRGVIVDTCAHIHIRVVGITEIPCISICHEVELESRG